MDLSAEEQGRLSQDEETPDLDQTVAGDVERRLEGTGASEHQFQKAISAWRSIDLVTLVPQLDQTASVIVDNQKDSLIQRKELAQKTKDFRKLEDTAKLTEFKTLLKAYQGFVDLLTNHGKTTSSAFLQLYSTISEAPDPYPLLEASIDSLLVSEDTVPKITAENEHLQKSIRNLSRDLENTEARLQQERTLRIQLEESRDTKTKEIESSWQAVLDEKKDNWEAKERALEEKLENQERLLNEIKASYEVSQRLGQNSEGDHAHNSASIAELEIVNADLERTSHRLAEVEARNEQLRVELAQVSSNARTNIEDDPAFSRLQSENSSLLRKLDTAKLDRESETRKVATKSRALERDIQSLQQEKDELRQKLHQWRDYPELKRDLEVFKTIEFAAGDEEDGDSVAAETNLHSRDSSLNGTAGGKKETLEQLLFARNKKLSSEMAMLRVSDQESQEELQKLREEVSTKTSNLERAQSLNVTLENDLLTLQQEASNQFPMSAKSVSSRYPTSPYVNRNRKGSPTSSIISGFDPTRSPLDIYDSQAVGGGSGILPMVQAQRDRFKQKNLQLENDLSKQYNIVSSLRQEIASLQKDNLNLYEKTRYASTYQRSTPQSSTSAVQINDNGSNMDRYRSAYEANISPFAAFRGRESARAYKRMSMPERLIYSITRLVLANRMSRNLFAAYCVALHLLVFVMLYWVHGADLEKHGSLAAVTAAGAAAAGGPAQAGVGDTGTTPDSSHWRQEGLDGGRPG